MVVKRYSNRRLYDSDLSRYVTIDEVAERIRAGADVAVVDAPTGDDITQVFLAQIILEGRGAARLLPVPLLYRLIRMGDDALADFFGRYVTWALDVYLRVKQGARTMAVYTPLASVPLAATDALARWLGGFGGGPPAWGGAPWGPPAAGGPTGFPPPPPAAAGGARYEPGEEDDAAGFMAVAESGHEDPPVYGERGDAPASSADLAALRAELEALKASLRGASGARGPTEGGDADA